MSIKEMIAKIRSAANNPVLSGTLVVSVGVFVGTIFSYLLQIGLGNLLSVEDFGTFNALLSLSLIFGIPAGAISTSLIKTVSGLLADRDFYTLRKLFWSLTKVSLGLGLILAILFIILNKEVAQYLNINHSTLMLIFSAFLALAFVNVAPVAYLQGLLRFKAFAFLSLVSQFLRLVIPLGLVYAGLAVPGTFVGLILVGGLSFMVSVALLKKNLKMGTTATNNPLDPGVYGIYKQLLMFSVPVFFINSGTVVMNNIDVVMAKHFFSPFEAGTYSGLVTMCKVLLYGASMVQVVMYPQISHLFALKANYKERFIKFLMLQLLFILGGLVVYIMFPSLINTLMFRGKFEASVPYLPLFSVYIALYVLIIFLSMFLLAINKTKAYMFIIPACLLQLSLITIYHGSIWNFIHINILAAALTSLFISIYVIKSTREGFDHRPYL